MRRLVTGTIASLFVLTTAGPVWAQQGYPPPFDYHPTTTTIQQGGGGVSVSTTTVPSTSTTVVTTPSTTPSTTPASTTTTTTGTHDGGTAHVGRTLVLEACGFAPGSSVHVVVNGTDVGNKTADRVGCIHVRIRIVSATRGLVDDPVPVTLKATGNTVVASGKSSAGAAVSQTVTFGVQAAQSHGRGPGNMAFTGANVIRWSAVALSLLAVGAGVLLADRRRARRANR